MCLSYMGDKTASAVSSETLYKSATLFEKEYSIVTEDLRHSTYVDYVVDSTSASDESAVVLVENTDTVL